MISSWTRGRGWSGVCCGWLGGCAAPPPGGGSATGIDERERRNWVRMPCRPRYFTRTCSRSALDFARAASPRAPFRISLARLSATLGLRGFSQLGDRRRVLCRQLAQARPVIFVVRLLERVHEHGIRQPERPGGSVEAVICSSCDRCRLYGFGCD